MHPVIDKQTAPHYSWGDQCEAWALMERPELSIKLERMPPGTKEKLHFHREARQFFYVFTGRAAFYIDNEKKTVYSRQGIPVEPGMKHFIANESDEDLEFMVISQPSADHDRNE